MCGCGVEGRPLHAKLGCRPTRPPNSLQHALPAIPARLARRLSGPARSRGPQAAGGLVGRRRRGDGVGAAEGNNRLHSSYPAGLGARRYGDGAAAAPCVHRPAGRRRGAGVQLLTMSVVNTPNVGAWRQCPRRV